MVETYRRSEKCKPQSCISYLSVQCEYMDIKGNQIKGDVEMVKLPKVMSLVLADISERIGYQDMKHLTRVFRKKFHVTPTEYRQAQVMAVSG